MHIYIFLSLAVAVVGAIMWIVCKDAKYGEIGRLAFFAGLFVFLMQFGPYLIGK